MVECAREWSTIFDNLQQSSENPKDFVSVAKEFNSKKENSSSTTRPSVRKLFVALQSFFSSKKNYNETKFVKSSEPILTSTD